jgi:adenine/guanine phosphoribosyltransferase-like PRPP-binding protein
MDATSPGTTCRFCGAHAGEPFAVCFCCATLVRQLQMPLVPLVAVGEFRPGDALHRRLRRYKDAPVAELRSACTARLAAMLGTWLATGPIPARLPTQPPWDLVVTVPSSCRPEGEPMAAVVEATPTLGPRHRRLLARGPVPTGHLRAARHGFVLRPDTDLHRLRGQRAVVVDDSVVTGARAQSAAAALRLGGLDVVGVVVVGRLVSGPPTSPAKPPVPA